jgi:hypothetical protein
MEHVQERVADDPDPRIFSQVRVLLDTLRKTRSNGGYLRCQQNVYRSFFVAVNKILAWEHYHISLQRHL